MANKRLLDKPLPWLIEIERYDLKWLKAERRKRNVSLARIVRMALDYFKNNYDVYERLIDGYRDFHED